MSSAHIYEQGYRRYDGERLGVKASISSLAIHSMRRGLGLRRTFWAKLLPLATVFIAYVPAMVFVGIAAIIPEELTNEVDAIPSYAGYFGNITIAIVLFVAMVGPEVLCADRKNGMLGMYLASPLTRETYLIAKVLGVAPVLLLVTLGPELLLLVGRSLVDQGPESVGDFVIVLVRVLVAGTVLSAIYTAVSLAAASLTDRRAFASAGVILLISLSAATTGVLVEEADLDSRLYLLNLGMLPIELVFRIFGEPGGTEMQSLATATLVAAAALWIAGSGAIVWWRYRRLTISR